MSSLIKGKVFGIFCLLQCLALYAIAQQANAIKPYKVGDKVTSLASDSIVSPKESTIDLETYRGKAIILDFWATWCKPCIGAFPKLQAMQQKYQDQLKIILLSTDKKEKLKHFYSVRPEFDLPTIFYRGRDSINKLFPHAYLPHYVWLDTAHRVFAITNADELTEENVKHFLQGKKIDMYQKDDSLALLDLRGMVVDSIVNTDGLINSISIDSVIAYGSQISRYDWRVTGGRSINKHGYENRYLEFRNNSIPELYRFAHNGYRMDKADKELFLIDSDRDGLLPPASNDKKAYKEFEKNHTYSYRVILPPHKADSALRYAYMQRDLEEFFGLRAVYEERELDCMVLRCADPAVLATKGGKPHFAVQYLDYFTLQNQPVEKLILGLRTFYVNYIGRGLRQSYYPIINESGIIGNMDLDLQHVTSEEKLIQALKQHGLSLTVEKRVVKVLVLK